MATSNERRSDKGKLIHAALSWAASDKWFDMTTPGPNDDAEMEMRDELLLEAARAYVASHSEVTAETEAELAAMLCQAVRYVRLTQIGEPAEIEGGDSFVPFRDMPPEDRAQWHQVARAVIELKSRGKL